MVQGQNGLRSKWPKVKTAQGQNDPRSKWPKLSFKSLEQRFNMEEDTKGRGREKFPLSFNIIAAQEI